MSPSEPPAEAEAWSEPPRKSPPRLADETLHRERDTPGPRRLGPRRDAEPDRGTVVLALGIISLALILASCAPIGAILGMVAWIMGQIDLRKMKNGQMDAQNRSMTQAGWICGILGTVLNTLVMLTCGLFLGAIWYGEMNRTPHTQPAPVTRPVRPAPPQRGPVPPPQPPPNIPPRNPN